MKLSIAEKFLLIAHHPVKGRFNISDIHITYGIIGAFLLEMSAQNQIAIENDRLVVKKSPGIDNQIISEISSQIAGSVKIRKLNYWISKLSRKSRVYKWAILKELEQKGVIRIENRKFLGIIPYKKSYLIDSIIRDNLIQQLKNSILFHKDLNDDTIAVSGLTEACQMHRIITSDRDELKVLRKELKQVLKDSPIADTVNKTIKSVQAAIIASIAAASFASSSASSH